MKVKVLVFTAGLITITLMVGFFIMRKQIPYDFEIKQGDGHLWVINITEWAKKDCTVTLVSGGGEKRKFVVPGATKAVKISNLINGKTYNLSIARNDLLGAIKYQSKKYQAVPSSKVEKYVVLLGASVGRSWDLNHLSSRIKDTHFYFGYRGLYEFNKEPLIKELVNSPIKPDLAIIKECAAYFPRKTDQGIEKIKQWVSELQNAGIRPILATVVPVTRKRNLQDQPDNPMASINAFNEAVRSFGEKENIPVLDLQKILSPNNNDGYLDEKFAGEDGLHLSNDAYIILDDYIVNFLKK